MPELCPKCGTPKHEIEVTRDILRPYTQDEWDEVTTYEMLCPLCPKDCRIKELERQLEEAKAINRNNPSCMMPDGADPCDAFQVALRLGAEKRKLESERDEALARLEEAKTEVYTLKTMPYAQELEAKVAELQSERDAALAQVGAKAELISAIAFASAKKWKVPAQEFYEQFQPWAQNLCRHHIANNTSATAQQFVEKVRREALEEAAERALQTDYSLYSGPRQDALLRAAILGEKEKG